MPNIHPALLSALLGSAVSLAGCSASQAADTAGTSAPAAAAAGAGSNHPVVVELFQSQGCSSCPPANANLNAIADRPDVIALSFAVTYCDQLGWKDTFGSPRWTARQWEYARHGARAQVIDAAGDRERRHGDCRQQPPAA